MLSQVNLSEVPSRPFQRSLVPSMADWPSNVSVSAMSQGFAVGSGGPGHGSARSPAAQVRPLLLALLTHSHGAKLEHELVKLYLAVFALLCSFPRARACRGAMFLPTHTARVRQFHCICDVQCIRVTNTYISSLSEILSVQQWRMCTHIRASPLQEPSGLPMDVSRYSSMSGIFNGSLLGYYAMVLAVSVSYFVRRRRCAHSASRASPHAIRGLKTRICTTGLGLSCIDDSKYCDWLFPAAVGRLRG